MAWNARGAFWISTWQSPTPYNTHTYHRTHIPELRALMTFLILLIPCMTRLWCVYEWVCFLLCHDPMDIEICADPFVRESTLPLFIDAIGNFKLSSCQCFREASRMTADFNCLESWSDTVVFDFKAMPHLPVLGYMTLVCTGKQVPNKILLPACCREFSSWDRQTGQFSTTRWMHGRNQRFALVNGFTNCFANFRFSDIQGEILQVHCDLAMNLRSSNCGQLHHLLGCGLIGNPTRSQFNSEMHVCPAYFPSDRPIDVSIFHASYTDISYNINIYTKYNNCISIYIFIYVDYFL